MKDYISFAERDEQFLGCRKLQRTLIFTDTPHKYFLCTQCGHAHMLLRRNDKHVMLDEMGIFCTLLQRTVCDAGDDVETLPVIECTQFVPRHGG